MIDQRLFIKNDRFEFSLDGIKNEERVRELYQIYNSQESVIIPEAHYFKKSSITSISIENPMPKSYQIKFSGIILED